ncbi:MAG: hypothetical protein HFE84_06025 [Lachnospiraceae bacterium]|nr:hypothetical protein [Lachnospiraceae bacterium]
MDAYRNSATEDVARKLQGSCLSDKAALRLYEINHAAGKLTMLKDFMARKTEYGPRAESVTTVANQNIRGTKTVIAPSGQYIIAVHEKLPGTESHSIFSFINQITAYTIIQIY